MTLRARLLIGMAVVAAVLVATAAIAAHSTEAHLVDQVDAQLRSAVPQVRDLDRAGRRDADGGEPRRLSELYLGILTARGDLATVLTPDLGGGGAPVPRVDQAAASALRRGEATTVPSGDPDVRYRMVARADDALGRVAVLALPLDDVDAAVRRLLAVEAIAVTAVLAALGVVAWWVVRLGVRPVQQMTAAARAIAGGDLSHRVPQGAPGTEAGELGGALNAMLSRIEDSFEQRAAAEARLRQFVADASHELRTPVTTIRGYAELYRTGGLEASGDLDEAMRRTEQEAERMGALVDDLLHLARLDQGRPLERAPLDVAAVVRDAAADARATEPEREVVTAAADAVVVLGDERRLRQIVANLVANALDHAPGARIELAATSNGVDAVVEVRDRGPGMSAADAARAFERFYRADASRARQRGGSGLGLAIVEATVRAHGGSVELDTEPGRGTTVRVRLPLAGGPWGGVITP